jgi:hypothetical protein
MAKTPWRIYVYLHAFVKIVAISSGERQYYPSPTAHDESNKMIIV